MSPSEFKKIITDELVAHGFNKDGQSFVKAASEVACFVGIQKSRFSGDYYVNVGLLIRTLHPDLSICDFADGDVRTRIVPKLAGNDPELFEIEKLEATAVKATVSGFIRSMVEPSLSIDGLRGTLAANPVLLYQTTLAAKRALGLS